MYQVTFYSERDQPELITQRFNMKNNKMKRKFILCPFRNGYFWLLFICTFLNSADGWTAQNSVINSKNFVQRICFEFLHRVYKTQKIFGYVLYECPSIKYVPSKFWSFIHPVLPVCFSLFVLPLMTPFPTKVLS